MATLDSDDLRAITGFKAVTWVDTSGNAKTTIEAASAGTLVRLGPGTHALGANVVNVPDGVSVTGCGMGVTTITSTTDSLEDETGAIFCPGSNGYYADFTVAATSFDNTKFQVPFGWFVFQSASTNILVERVETYALVDGFYFDEGSSIVHMRDCVARSNWDALVITSGVEVFSERLRLYCIGPNTIGSQQTRAVNLDGSAIWHDRNSELVTWSTAGGAADSSIGVQGGPVRHGHQQPQDQQHRRSGERPLLPQQQRDQRRDALQRRYRPDPLDQRDPPCRSLHVGLRRSQDRPVHPRLAYGR
jgi:hypothetical protein